MDCRPAQPPAPPTRRERRASKFVLKCRDLLRALIKEPFASIFYDPVDPIKLGIPDYPKIVTNPMSLSEVSIRLEGNEYSIPENFQEDVKLTFSNAIKYNTQDGETNEVRVAAFTLLTRFNSMYSAMLQELQGDSQPDAPPTPGLAAEQTGSGGGGGGGSARGAKGARGPPPKSAAVLADEKRREEAAALQTEISQAQQKMNSMRSRLVDLQKAVLKDDAKDAARAVLPTQKELRALVTAVQGLPRRKLEVVLQIVQTALPRSHPLMARGAGAEGQSISLPIEDLDVFTVRTLMDAVRGASG